tara:strand:+ start:640 stop:1731 length:1092 start_codon:yes stop_codon:yes gene_type:complete
MSVSVITILEDVNMIPLIKENWKNMRYHDKQLIIVDDNKNTSVDKFTDVEDCLYLFIDDVEKKDYFKKIIEKDKQPNKDNIKFAQITNKLPIGFKRDYGCEFSEGKYILHMNDNCIYNEKVIERKKKFLEKTGSECIYNDTVLCYDMYGNDIYKSISGVKIYESTLFYTRTFWERRGFNWIDCQNEGKYFHYNNGIDRKMDNYYDTVQLLTINNINIYNPIKIELENMEISIPPCVNMIECREHPFKKLINSIASEGSIVGINSEYLENAPMDGYAIKNITGKWKQTKLSKMIDGIDHDFLVYGSKHVAWSLFNEISFKIIILETSKNHEQMEGIILGSKKNTYIKINGIYVNKKMLVTEVSN